MHKEKLSTKEKIYNVIYGSRKTSDLSYQESEELMMQNANSVYTEMFKGLAKDTAKDAADHILVSLAGCAGIGMLVSPWDTNVWAKVVGGAFTAIPAIQGFVHGVKGIVSSCKYRKLLKVKGYYLYGLAKRYGKEATTATFTICDQVLSDGFKLYLTRNEAVQLDKALAEGKIQDDEAYAEKREKLHNKIEKKYNEHMKYCEDAASFLF